MNVKVPCKNIGHMFITKLNIGLTSNGTTGNGRTWYRNRKECQIFIKENIQCRILLTSSINIGAVFMAAAISSTFRVRQILFAGSFLVQVVLHFSYEKEFTYQRKNSFEFQLT